MQVKRRQAPDGTRVPVHVGPTDAICRLCTGPGRQPSRGLWPPVRYPDRLLQAARQLKGPLPRFFPLPSFVSSFLLGPISLYTLCSSWKQTIEFWNQTNGRKEHVTKAPPPPTRPQSDGRRASSPFFRLAPSSLSHCLLFVFVPRTGWKPHCHPHGRRSSS